MEANRPYCYLYKDIPNIGDLYVSTIVQLPADTDLKEPKITSVGRITIVTYETYEDPPVSLPAGIRNPPNEKITWDGIRDRIVVVVIADGGTNNSTTLNTRDL